MHVVTLSEGKAPKMFGSRVGLSTSKQYGDLVVSKSTPPRADRCGTPPR